MRKTTKLLAVVMLFGSAQAYAGVAADEVEAAKAEVMRTDYYQRAAIQAFAVSTPRVLATGAPACGNAMAKPSPVKCTAERADRLQAQRADDVARTITEATVARARLRRATVAVMVATARGLVGGSDKG